MDMNQFVPRYVQNLFWLKFDCISSEVYEDNLKMCLGRISIASFLKMFLEFSKLCLSQNWAASDQNYSKMPPNSVSAETQVHPIENNLRRFQFVTSANFNSVWLKLFPDMSKMSLRRSSIATYRNYSYTIPNCILAEQNACY